MPAGDATVLALTNILKTRYDQKKFYQLFYAKAPFHGTVAKSETFGGNNARISLRYGAPQGGSYQLPTAIANATSSSDVAFLLTRSLDYQVSGISGEAIASSKGVDDTIYDGLRGEMEGSMRNLNRSIQIGSWRNGGGQRGQGNSSYSVAGAVVTLKQASDIVGFEVLMKCAFSADDGYNSGGTLGGIRAGGPLQVIALDRVAGTITFNANINTLTGVTNADFIFRDGDYSRGPSGVLRWIPITAPVTGDNHFGVDRSVDVVRLAGVRYTGNGGNKEETLLDAAELAGREGATELSCYCNNLDRADIVKSLGSKAVYEPTKDTSGDIGYRAINIEGPDGTIKLYSDVNVPRGQFFLLDMDTWILKSAGGVPRMLDEDGNKMLREANNDGYQWRMGGYYNWACEAPGNNTCGTW